MPKANKQQRRFQTQRDYLLTKHESTKVPPPFNLGVPIAGPCIITSSHIGQEGYAGQEHREVFINSGGTFSDEQDKALHLCGRRYCIQPSHIYAGSARENKRDERVHRRKKASFGDYKRMHRIAMDRAGAVRLEHQLPLPLPESILSCEHEWLGDTDGCGICGMPKKRPSSDKWVWTYMVYEYEADTASGPHTYARGCGVIPFPRPGASSVISFQPTYAGQKVPNVKAEISFEYHPRLAVVRYGGREYGLAGEIYVPVC